MTLTTVIENWVQDHADILQSSADIDGVIAAMVRDIPGDIDNAIPSLRRASTMVTSIGANGYGKLAHARDYTDAMNGLRARVLTAVLKESGLDKPLSLLMRRLQMAPIGGDLRYMGALLGNAWNGFANSIQLTGPLVQDLVDQVVPGSVSSLITKFASLDTSVNRSILAEAGMEGLSTMLTPDTAPSIDGAWQEGTEQQAVLGTVLLGTLSLICPACGVLMGAATSLVTWLNDQLGFLNTPYKKPNLKERLLGMKSAIEERINGLGGSATPAWRKEREAEIACLNSDLIDEILRGLSSIPASCRSIWEDTIRSKHYGYPEYEHLLE